MKKNKFYYILITLISILVILNLTFVLAAEETLLDTALKTGEDASPDSRNFFSEIFQEFNKKIIIPVKQKINSIRNKKVDEMSNEIIDKVQEQVKEKQGELIDKVEEKTKQTIKEKSKKFIQNRMEWVKKILNPLKIKIQQGSDIVKEQFIKIKDYFKDLF